MGIPKEIEPRYDCRKCKLGTSNKIRKVESYETKQPLLFQIIMSHLSDGNSRSIFVSTVESCKTNEARELEDSVLFL